MVRHQHIGVNCATESSGKSVQLLEIVCVVVRGVEARGAIVAALDDMQRNSGGAKAGATDMENLRGAASPGRADANRKPELASIRAPYAQRALLPSSVRPIENVVCPYLSSARAPASACSRACLSSGTRGCAPEFGRARTSAGVVFANG